MVMVFPDEVLKMVGELTESRDQVPVIWTPLRKTMAGPEVP
jgi:hypothetical protein